MRDLDKDLTAYFAPRAEVPAELRERLRANLQAVESKEKLPVVWTVVPVALLALIAVIVAVWLATGNGVVLLLGVGYVFLSTTWAAAIFIMISLLNARVIRNADFRTSISI